MRQIFLLFFLFSSLLVSAQDTTRFRAVSIGIGSAHIAMRDALMSPLRYTGIGLVPQVGFYNQGKKAIHQLAVSYSYAKLTSSIYPDLTGNFLRNHRGELLYTYLRNTSANESKPLWLGAMFANTIDVRDHTSLFIFGEYVSSIHAAARISRDLQIGNKALQLTYTATTPIINFVVHPNYAYSPPDAFFEQNTYYQKGKLKRLFQSGNVYLPTRFFRFSNNLMLEKSIKGGNRLGVFYAFDIYLYGKENSTIKAQSSIGFILFTGI